MTADEVRRRAAYLAGHPLYSWQSRALTDHLLDGRVPKALDVPTGLGKTTVVSLWLAALSSGAPLPRRLVYVVDRRAVVDQATTEAERLSELLGTGDDADEETAAIRRTLLLPPGQRLPVSTLRGQYTDNRRWLEHPGLPAIIVGTVDMIGSRLLFSGYGVARRMRPVHAGLLGVDTLVVLDEAHLVPPFEALVRQIQQLRRSNEKGIAFPPLHVMSLSATGRTSDDAFRLQDEDLRDGRVAERLDAAKHLQIAPEAQAMELPRVLASLAWELGKPSAAVVIYCNSRKVAAAVADLLRGQVRDAHGKDAERVALLVGERRVHERQRLAGSAAFQRFAAEGRSDGNAGPAFLVATSAGEVGVDLDADHMVCDLVAWERMVQRLGRVNRRPASAHVAQVVVVPSQATTGKDEAETEINAARLKALLTPFELAEWPAHTTGCKDASTRALYWLRQNARVQPALDQATTPDPLSPELSVPLVNALSMTSLREHAGRPEIQPWLRGWVDDAPQTRVIWRRWLPVRVSEVTDAGRFRNLDSFLEDARPHLTEVLEAPTYRVVAVVRKRATRWLESLEESGAERQTSERKPPYPPVVVVLDSAGEVTDLLDANRIAGSRVEYLERLMAHATIIIDARFSGLDDNGLLDASASAPAATLDSPDATWPVEHDTGFRVRIAPANENDPAWRPVFRWSFDPEMESDDGMELRVEVLRAGSALEGDPAVSRAPQELDAHAADVADVMRQTAADLQLTDPVRRLFTAVADLHDAGKRRDLWQRAMGVPRDGRVYAKTAGRSNPRLLLVDGLTYRHEFGSLHDAIESGSFADVNETLRELALHLIASHHGEARPLIAPVDPDRPPSLCAPLAKDAARRFDRLNCALGPWELAWLEALFRAADWGASAAQQRQRKGEG